MIQITEQVIAVANVLRHVHSQEAGAVVAFLGTVREFTGERRTVALDYECYPAMAVAELQRLEGEARRQWQLVDVCIVHRVGHLTPGEVSVVIAVSSVHRQAAWEAGQWLIDTLKQVVPIWKREHWADGTAHWVHPAIQPARLAPP